MKMYFVVLVLAVTFCLGCEGLRFAPDQVQKQNAWLHNRTAQLAADMAQAEAASDELAGLTSLSEVQSRAFVADYGLPNQFPAESIEHILSPAGSQLAAAAFSSSANRPDGWDVAEGAIDLGIAIAALFGGAFGIKAAAFLRQARTKSDALRQVIQGNELFKRTNVQAIEAFKTAHSNQSPKTRQVVAELKNV